MRCIVPQWLSGKESTCQGRRCGFNPWVRKIPWRRKWQSTLVFLPGKSHGERSLVGCSPRSCKELDTMEELSMHAWRSIGGFSRGKAQFMLHFVRIAWLIYRGETAGGKRSREWRRGCQGGERQDDIIDASYLAWDRPENQTEWRWGFWLLRGVSWGLRSWVMRRGSVMLRTRQALGQTWSGWVESLFLFF